MSGSCGSRASIPQQRSTGRVVATVRLCLSGILSRGLWALAVLMAFGWGPASAWAAHLSRPVALSGLVQGPRVFAVNDRGQVVVVFFDGSRTVLGRVSTDGAVTAVQPLSLDRPSVGVAAASVALDRGGRVAVGLNYDDGAHIVDVRSPNSDKDDPCCLHNAIAAWRLGEQPPVAQTVSGPQPPYPQQATDQDLSPPEFLFGRSTLTALWDQGYQGQESGSGGHLQQAFGAFAGPLKSNTLTADFSDTANENGIDGYTLTRGPNGLAQATWQVAPDLLQSTAGAPSGRLRRPSNARTIHDLAHLELFVIGLAVDSTGDAVFAYQRANSGKVFLSEGASGQRFSAPRLIARVGHGNTHIVAGGHRQSLLVWSDQGRAFVQQGTVFGRWKRPQSLGATSGADPEAFIDANGNSLVVFNRDVGRHFHTAAFVATAARGKPFTHPTQLTSQARNCVPGPEPATSPDGHALIPLACGPNSDQLQIVRYSP